MSIEAATPGVRELPAIEAAIRSWPRDTVPLQLHPGDLGWNRQFGAAALAAETRTWRRDGALVAVALTDGQMARLAVEPAAQHDAALARRLADDVSDPTRGVLGAGAASVEARVEGELPGLLAAAGWGPGESWTPLVRELIEPVPDGGLRVELVRPGTVGERVAVHRASLERSTFTAQRWEAMATGPAYEHARSLGLRRSRRCRRHGDGVVRRTGPTRTHRAAGRPPRPPRSRPRPSDLAGRSGDAPGDGFVLCGGLHAKLQRRSRGDVPVGGLSPAARSPRPRRTG